MEGVLIPIPPLAEQARIVAILTRYTGDFALAEDLAQDALAISGWAVEARLYAEDPAKGFLPSIGKLELLAPVQSFPLNLQHAERYWAERLILIGDAAHGIHPIAGQGVNLGYRDVAALVEVLVEGRRLGLEAGDAQLLARYARWRGFDTFSVAAATDVLTRLFGVPGRAAGLVRRIGISAVDRLPPLKERFMAEARGESGHLPKLLTGLTV